MEVLSNSNSFTIDTCFNGQPDFKHNLPKLEPIYLTEFIHTKIHITYNIFHPLMRICIHLRTRIQKPANLLIYIHNH